MASRFDLNPVLDGQKLGAHQARTLVLSFLLMMSEGFDLSAAAFGGPSILKEFHADHTALGVLLSSSLAAGFLGLPLFGVLSDRFGRKRVIVAGALMFGLLTLATVTVTSFSELLVLRILAGLALGGTMPIIVTLNNEFAPLRLRATLVVIVFAGVTFGGGLPGLVAAKFMGVHGWRILFWVGGLAPLVLGALFWFLVDESPKFLALRPGRQHELVQILGKLRPDLHVSLNDVFFISGEENRPKFSAKSLLAGQLAVLTPLFWISNMIGTGLFYAMNQLMPTMLTDSGLSIEQASFATTAFNMGGTMAGLLTMRALDRVGFLPVPICFACAAPVLICIGLTGPSTMTLIILTTLAGFCLMGAQFGNIATEGNIYPTYIRSWGISSNFMAGRVGGALGPLMGGIAFAHFPPSAVFAAAAAPALVGLVAAILIVPRYRRRLAALNREQRDPKSFPAQPAPSL